MSALNIPAAESESTVNAWRVLVAMGNHGLAASESGGKVREIRFRRRIGRPLPGDRVLLDAEGGVSKVLPRNNLFGRGVRGRFQPLAANLDRLLIVIAPRPAPSPVLLDRYVAAAHIQGIAPTVVINKSDLPIPDAPPFDSLHALDCPVLRTVALDDGPMDELESCLAHGVHLLVGQSGVGKSSLANRLLPDLDLQTETLSRSTGKGRHTTTQARLFRTQGGWLADSPGVWEYGLWQMPRETLARGFPEFGHLAACRFRDCAHDGEPGCAVQTAVEEGGLDSSRLDAWHRLLKEQQRLGTGSP